MFYLKSWIFQRCYYLITSVLKRSIIYSGERKALNYRVIKTVCDREAVAAIHSVALGSQLVFFGYLGLSEPCCSLKHFLLTKVRQPWKWNWDRYCELGRHSKCGVGFSAALHLLLGKRVLASRVFLPCLC